MDVYGHDNVDEDCAAIECAIGTGADRIRLHGTFNFGEGEQRKTLTIWRAVILEGVDDLPWLPLGPPPGPPPDDPPPWGPHRHARIKGGGARNDDLGSHTGAFFVALAVNAGKVVIENIHFENFRFAAISAVRCHGLEVSHCTFKDPIAGCSDTFLNLSRTPLQSTSAVLAFGDDCQGSLHVIDNTCDFTQPIRDTLEDEQFVACAWSNFRSIRIVNNTIATRDDGIELLFNGNIPANTSPCEILIERNTITIDQQGGLVPAWPLHAGITCCLNGPAGTGSTTQVVGNTIVAHGENVSALAFSGDHFVVRDNRIELETDSEFFPTAAFWFGLDVGAEAIGNLGASLNDSDVYRNTISGAAGYGIFTNENTDTDEVNDSHGSVIEDNDFSGFEPEIVAVSAGFWERNANLDNIWPT